MQRYVNGQRLRLSFPPRGAVAAGGGGRRRRGRELPLLGRVLLGPFALPLRDGREDDARAIERLDEVRTAVLRGSGRGRGRGRRLA